MQTAPAVATPAPPWQVAGNSKVSAYQSPMIDKCNQLAMQLPCKSPRKPPCKPLAFVNLWLMGREGIRAATRRRAALVHCLPSQVAECSTWNNTLYVSPCLSLSSLLAEGVDLGARPHYCKPEEFLRKVIFCSSTSVHRALSRKQRQQADALTNRKTNEIS